MDGVGVFYDIDVWDRFIFWIRVIGFGCWRRLRFLEFVKVFGVGVF